MIRYNVFFAHRSVSLVVCLMLALMPLLSMIHPTTGPSISLNDILPMHQDARVTTNTATQSAVVAPTTAHTAAPAPQPVDLPAEATQDWWTAVQKNIHQAEYRITWQTKTNLPHQQAAYQAPNRTHNLRTYFTPTGIRVIPRDQITPDDTNSWQWMLSLAGVGYGDDIQPVATDQYAVPQMSVTDNRISYDWGTITEWYVNDERGLEQGYTLEHRLPPPSPQHLSLQGLGALERGSPSPLVLALNVQSNLTPALVETDNGQAITFTRPEADGTQALRYSNLHVYDATGRELSAHLELVSRCDGARVRRCDDATKQLERFNVSAFQRFNVSTSVSFRMERNGAGESGTHIASRDFSTALDMTRSWIDRVAGLHGASVSAFRRSGVPAFQHTIHIVIADQDAVYPLTIDPMATTPSWNDESNQVEAYFGQYVGTAGDVNNDGFSDVIVGADWYDNGTSDEGAAFIYHGSASGLSTTPDKILDADNPSARFGISVGTAGDVNKDGYSDVIIGSDQYDNGHTDEGIAFVFHGSASGVSSTPSWSKEGNQDYAWFGFSVGTAGDVNKDGYSDIIVSAFDYDNGQNNEGKVYVYHGSPSGVSDTVAWSDEGDQADAQFGWSVGTAGDVNNDGYSDVIIGAHMYDNGTSDEGAAFIYHGSGSGLSLTPNRVVDSGQGGCRFGVAVGTAGDVNGDGYSDVIVGAPDYDNDQLNEGKVFIYHGSASGIPASANWTNESNQQDSSYGWSVGTAGDVNGDGYSDVIVGAFDYDNGENDEGAAFIYYGSDGSMSTTAAWTGDSNKMNSDFGLSVGTAGDVNNDGFSDVIVGSPDYTSSQTQEGAAFVYYGAGDFNIKGSVTKEGGSPVEGVAITTNTGAATTTASDGNYTVTDLVSNTYTLTPTLTGYTFTPVSRVVSIPPNATGQNFIATPITIQFSSANYAVQESDGSVAITVTLNHAATEQITVDYATSDGTATAGSDYTAKSGTLTFPVGQTIATFSVPISSDAVYEGDGYETANLTLQSPANATLGTPAQATMTIIDDEAPPPKVQFSSTSYIVNETDNSAIITVTLNRAATEDVQVDYATSDGTATAGSDYTATSNVLTIPAGQTSGTFTVPIANDMLTEGDETCTVKLHSPVNAKLGTSSQATITINNVVPPEVQFSSANYPVEEIDGSAAITVTLNKATNRQVTVDYATSDGTATASSDYTATNNTLAIPAGHTSGTFTIPIQSDTESEEYETVNVTLNSPTNATLGTPAHATMTIIDQGTQPPSVQFSSASYTINESDGNVLVTVTLSRASTEQVTVDYATSDGTATAGSDYTATSNVLTIPVGQTSGSFAVPITNDIRDEGDESFTVKLHSPVNAELGPPSQATITINNVVPPEVQFSSANYPVQENAGSATITVTLNKAAPSQVTVDYATSDGTATAGSDYTATNKTLTIPVGQTSGTFTVPIKSDTESEEYETVNVTLNSPTNATLGIPAQATMTIIDENAELPTLQFSSATYAVNEADNSATITVTMNRATIEPVTVGYATSDGTATAGSDYTATSSVLTIPVGQINGSFAVPITNDTLIEGSEAFTITLQTPSNAKLGTQQQAIVTISDDEDLDPNPPTIQFSSETYIVNECTSNAIITVTLSKAAKEPVEVGYTTRDGTAISKSDYTSTSGTVTLLVGQTSSTFTIAIHSDIDAEADETINLILQSPTNATLGTPEQAIVTITNSACIVLNEEPELSSIWETSSQDQTTSVAWGDYDQDGDLDLAIGIIGGTNRVYRNNDGVLEIQPIWESKETDDTYSVAWGDIDRDGDFELAVGNVGAPNRLYMNDGEGLEQSASWWSDETDDTWDIAWGDYDQDGYIDLAVANAGAVKQSGQLAVSQPASGAPNRIYRNAGTMLNAQAEWTLSDESDVSTSLAWSDYDDDGDLDLAVGNLNGPDRLYRNETDTPTGALTLAQNFPSGDTWDLDWGDYDSDGDHDLIVGRDGQNLIYRNDDATLVEAWRSEQSHQTRGVVWCDLNSDGNFDLVVANHQNVNELYVNHNGTLPLTPTRQIGDPSYNTWGIDWGDLDGDFDDDIAFGNMNAPDQVYLSTMPSLSSFYPNKVVANAGTIPVAIHGANLTQPEWIEVGGIPLTNVTLINPTTVQAMLPVAALEEGTYDLTMNTGGYMMILNEALTIEPSRPSHRFRVMIYLACDNDLESNCEHLFNELELVLATTPAIDSHLEILVLWDGTTIDDSAYYIIQPDKNLYKRAAYTDEVNRFALGEVNTGSSNTLVSFILWAQSQYPAKYSVLSMVGHGGGWAPDMHPAQGSRNKSGGSRNKSGGSRNKSGIGTHKGGGSRNKSGGDSIKGGGSRNKSGGSRNKSGGDSIKGGGSRNKSGNDLIGGMLLDDLPVGSLTTRDMAEALAYVTFAGTEEKPNQIKPIDVVYLDACLMSTMEVLAEVAPYTEYLVAHESIAWSIFPYSSYLNTITAQTTPRDLALHIAEMNRASWYTSPPEPAQIGVIEARQVEPMLATWQELTDVLSTTLDTNHEIISRTLKATKRVDEKNDWVITTDDSYIDAYDFCKRLTTNAQTADTPMGTAARHVMKAIDDLTIYHRAQDGHPWNQVLPDEYWELENALHGVSVYFPFADEWRRPLYGASSLPSFDRATMWPGFMQQWFDGQKAPSPITPTLIQRSRVALTLHVTDTVQVQTGDTVTATVLLTGLDTDSRLKKIAITVVTTDSTILMPSSGSLQWGTIFPTDSDSFASRTEDEDGWTFEITTTLAINSTNKTKPQDVIVAELPFVAIAAGEAGLVFASSDVTNVSDQWVDHRVGGTLVQVSPTFDTTVYLPFVVRDRRILP